jgi:uncharacterized protein YdaL
MFESLENVLMQIMQSLHRQEQMMQLVITHFKNKNDVAKFLGVSVGTINNYIKDGRFELGKHYFINEKNNIEFIPTGIVDFKDKSTKQNRVVEVKTPERHLHPTARKFLGGQKVG